MFDLKLKFRIITLCGTLFGFFLTGCASGPVTTEIDKNKNPVVSAPSNFQSPIVAIEGLLDATVLKNRSASELQNLRRNHLNILLNQQASVKDELEKTGRLLLRPGFSYEFDLESFCVNAGVERPIVGDGLFLGDIQGPAKDWLPVILKNYKSKNISQEEAQVLIWSLLSKTRFNDLSLQNQTLLLILFPDAAIKFGHSFIESEAKSLLFSQLPADLLNAKDQIEKYQELLQNTQLTFSEIEKTLSPASSRNQPLPVGWLKHEDGYYIHLEAKGYQQTKIKIYVPDNIKKSTYFEPTKHVALPGQGQRLALSAIVIDQYKDRANQFVKNKTGVSARESLFILKHPLDAVKIHHAAQTAIQQTWSNLKSSHNYEDDHTDAFRHFVWSGLVAREIGYEKAKEFLEAHEDFPENNPAAKSMDLFNNQKGLEYERNYKGQSFEQDLIKNGLEKIQRKELQWIK